jgi:hypothetical protein
MEPTLTIQTGRGCEGSACTTTRATTGPGSSAPSRAPHPPTTRSRTSALSRGALVRHHQTAPLIGWRLG